MISKVIFDVSNVLMRWEEKSKSADKVVFTLLSVQVFTMGISVLSIFLKIPWLLILSSIMLLGAAFINILAGHYTRIKIRTIPKLTTRVKILGVTWWILLIIWLILVVEFLLRSI